MLQLGPILLALIYALVMFRFSAWRLNRQLDQTSARLQDAELQTQIDKMAGAMQVRDIPVYVQNSPTINGLAAPDGRVFITQGFIDKFKMGEVSAGEIASVIAHELGHVALGHSRKRMIDFSGQNAMRVALGAILSRFLPGIGGIIANGLGSLLMAKLSRSDELMQSGLSVEAQMSLFEKLDKLTGNAGLSPAWLLSHPKAQDRIAAIQSNYAKWQ
jgi:putative metalloprotease